MQSNIFSQGWKEAPPPLLPPLPPPPPGQEAFPRARELRILLSLLILSFTFHFYSETTLAAEP
jgi:hypothetical protein